MALPETPERERQELDLQVTLGPALIAIKGQAAPEVERAFDRARELCLKLGETAQLFPVLRGLMLYHQARGQLSATAQLGEDLYDWGAPTGFPDVSPFWISPGTAVRRFNEGEAMSRGSYGLDFTYPVAGGTSAQIVDALTAALFLAPPSNETRGAAIGFLDVLPEPDQGQRVEQTAAVLLSSPEFLTH